MKQSAMRMMMIQFIIDYHFNELGWIDLEESECHALNMLSRKPTKELTQLYNQYLSNLC
jgi:hypothetical protein